MHYLSSAVAILKYMTLSVDQIANSSPALTLLLSNFLAGTFLEDMMSSSSIGTILRFRQAEECPYSGQETQATPEESCLSFYVPCRWRHESRFKDLTNYVGKIVCASSEDDRLCTKPCSPNLGDKCIDDGPDRYGVSTQSYQTQGSLGILDGSSLRNTSLITD